MAPVGVCIGEFAFLVLFLPLGSTWLAGVFFLVKDGTIALGGAAVPYLLMLALQYVKDEKRAREPPPRGRGP